MDTLALVAVGDEAAGNLGLGVSTIWGTWTCRTSTSSMDRSGLRSDDAVSGSEEGTRSNRGTREVVWTGRAWAVEVASAGVTALRCA